VAPCGGVRARIALLRSAYFGAGGSLESCSEKLIRRMIWDIQIRHLDEAEFLLEMWNG